jgi:FlaA1/EpsC-like NDP-sugar epimerase
MDEETKGLASTEGLQGFRAFALRFARQIRATLVLGVYGVISTVSLWLAYQLRFDFFYANLAPELRFREAIPTVMLWVVPIKVVVSYLFKQHQGLLSYFGTPDLYRLLRSMIVASAVISLVRLQFPSDFVPPRGVILIDFIVSMVLLAGFRTTSRLLRESLVQSSPGSNREQAYRIAIIGAGDVGASLAKELLNKRGLGRVPVVFLDDDNSKLKTRIHNIPVIGSPEILVEAKDRFRIEEAIIAMPSAPAKRIGEIVKILQKLHVKFVTAPSLEQMATGKVSLTRFRPVEIQDLLGREPVSIEREDIREIIQGQVVLVTGAGGSIGSELCRQVVSFNPSRLLMVEQSEYLLFEIEQELVEKGYGGTVLPLVANILDEARINDIFGRFSPNTVFHAAALKHVPMMESQPSEAIKVNSLGTKLLADIALKSNVDRFVMISTDKAINPTSVMGATKRMAEMYIQALSASELSRSTRFMAVRFGNVLGSSGSVIPTFNRQILRGGPLKITHPEVTRYFMTIPEAVGLVLQCVTQGTGGEIFVLDMGDSVKIVDLARQLIELNGLRPDEDIELEFIGLRPGEKLYEELKHSGENMIDTGHSKVMRFVCEAQKKEDVEKMLDELREALYVKQAQELKDMLARNVPEYRPYLDG